MITSSHSRAPHAPRNDDAPAPPRTPVTAGPPPCFSHPASPAPGCCDRKAPAISARAVALAATALALTAMPASSARAATLAGELRIVGGVAVLTAESGVADHVEIGMPAEDGLHFRPRPWHVHTTGEGCRRTGPAARVVCRTADGRPISVFADLGDGDDVITFRTGRGPRHLRAPRHPPAPGDLFRHLLRRPGPGPGPPPARPGRLPGVAGHRHPRRRRRGPRRLPGRRPPGDVRAEDRFSGTGPPPRHGPGGPAAARAGAPCSRRGRRR